MKLSEITTLVSGELRGNPSTEITGIARIEEARKGDITWLSHPKYQRYLNKTRASCIIVSEDVVIKNTATIKVENTALAIATLIEAFYPQKLPRAGISKLAYVGKGAKLGKNVSLGAFSYVGEKSIIGDNVTIFPRVYVAEGVKIGAGTIIYPNVTLRTGTRLGKNIIIHPGVVIGSDGFAYTKVRGKHHKIPHRGGVVIEDNVEIGACTTINRSVLGNTVIKKGTKIDNLVHIAHNVVIGENSIVIAQVGVAGSVQIGKNVVLAGQAGIGEHLTIGNNAVIAARAAVTKDVPPKATVSGYPARPHKDSQKAYSLLIRLPELFRRVTNLERQCKPHRQ